jgi:hypothetical protein
MRNALKGVRNSASRQALVVIGLGLLVAGVAFTPSLAGSFLTKHKAKKIFVTKADAGKTYETQADAASSFLGKSALGTAVAASGSPFSSNSTTPVSIPGASASVNVPGNAILVVQFSGVSRCNNTADGYNCPIAISVDGGSANPPPEGGGDYRFDGSISQYAAHSLTVSKPVGAGTHTVTVGYHGCPCSPTPTFTMQQWHLLVQSFPG